MQKAVLSRALGGVAGLLQTEHFWNTQKITVFVHLRADNQLHNKNKMGQNPEQEVIYFFNTHLTYTYIQHMQVLNIYYGLTERKKNKKKKN